MNTKKSLLGPFTINNPYKDDYEAFRILNSPNRTVDKLSKAINLTIARQIFDYQAVIPDYFSSYFSSWDEVYNKFRKEWEVILDCPCTSFNDKGIDLLKSVIDTKRTTLEKTFKNFPDISNVELIKLKVLAEETLNLCYIASLMDKQYIHQFKAGYFILTCYIYDEINNRRDRAKFPIYTALYLLWGSDKHYNYIKGVLKGVIKNWYLPDGTKKIFKRQSNKNPESEQDQLIEELFINLSGKRYDKAIEKEELEVALIGGTKYINYIPNALKYRFKDKIYTRVAKRFGSTDREAREYIKKKSELNSLINKGIQPPEELKEYVSNFQKIKEIPIVDTDIDTDTDFQEGRVQLKDEVNSKHNHDLTDANTLLTQYSNQLAPQAKSQKKLCEFLIEKGIFNYIKDNRISKNKFKIKELSDDSHIPYRSVKNFLKELKDYIKTPTVKPPKIGPPLELEIINILSVS